MKSKYNSWNNLIKIKQKKSFIIIFLFQCFFRLYRHVHNLESFWKVDTFLGFLPYFTLLVLSFDCSLYTYKIHVCIFNSPQMEVASNTRDLVWANSPARRYLKFSSKNDLWGGLDLATSRLSTHSRSIHFNLSHQHTDTHRQGCYEAVRRSERCLPRRAHPSVQALSLTGKCQVVITYTKCYFH